LVNLLIILGEFYFKCDDVRMPPSGYLQMDIKKSKSWKPSGKFALGTIVTENNKTSYSISLRVLEQDTLQDDVLLGLI
jgi:hypothetical protein